ncbi:hypothetical protein [Nocardia nepalensis]|uniref:hypothetical protein n=1 Tax=Nocardia nepalensis TaxID=3375448 RepID=UPI003B67E937
MSATWLVVAALVVAPLVVACDAGFPPLSVEHAAVAATSMATTPADRHHLGIIAIRLSKSQGAPLRDDCYMVARPGLRSLVFLVSTRRRLGAGVYTEVVDNSVS